MVYKTVNQKYNDGTKKTLKYLFCGSYYRTGKSGCTSHRIGEEILYELVLADIREKAQYAEYDYDGLLERLVYLKESEQRGFIASAEQELKAVNKDWLNWKSLCKISMRINIMEILRRAFSKC